MQPIEAGAAVAPLGAGDALVFERGCDAPAGARRGGGKRALLVVGRLVVGADPEIDRRAHRLCSRIGVVRALYKPMLRSPAASPRKPSPRHGRVPTGFSYT